MQPSVVGGQPSPTFHGSTALKWISQIVSFTFCNNWLKWHQNLTHYSYTEIIKILFYKSWGWLSSWLERNKSDPVCELLTENQAQLTQASQWTWHNEVSYLSNGGPGHSTIIPYPLPQHRTLHKTPIYWVALLKRISRFDSHLVLHIKRSRGSDGDNHDTIIQVTESSHA